MIYHIADADDWARARVRGTYTTSTRGVTLDEQGYLHASTADQVAGVANSFYQGVGNLVLLAIDEARVTSEVRYEDVPGQASPFPHIYGPLNVDAVVDTAPFAPDADGRYRFDGPRRPTAG